MLEKEINSIESYFDENSLIEDEYYNGIKDSIKCKYCNNILKSPMMCEKCQWAFCNNCTEEIQNDNHKCENPSYIENKLANSLLGNLKYLCKNCKCEIKQSDIENHLIKKCVKNDNPIKYIDELYRKQKLIKLDSDEIKKIPGNKMNHISSKKILLILLFNIIVILLGKSNVGKSSLVNT